MPILCQNEIELLRSRKGVVLGLNAYPTRTLPAFNPGSTRLQLAFNLGKTKAKYRVLAHESGTPTEVRIQLERNITGYLLEIPIDLDSLRLVSLNLQGRL